MTVVTAGSGQQPAQPPYIDTSLVERVIQGAVPAPVLGRQRQIDQRFDRPVRAQHRVGQLEQRIRPRVQTPVDLLPESRQQIDCFHSGAHEGHNDYQ
ncbi:hypothetical protein Asi03nite_68480 [Actinoplanes siamensis]|uniref:Uncharacterized protein n=1 Tax=Actinoplanes siamensis TaxID=1223317 RepID=A0A919TPY5_9ACTN|nr:hypothetical protein Asi03nite_68480 [Actinoplanes siamensis]